MKPVNAARRKSARDGAGFPCAFMRAKANAPIAAKTGSEKIMRKASSNGASSDVHIGELDEDRLGREQGRAAARQ